MVFLSAYLAHLLSDFIFQSDKLIKKKENLRIKGFLVHAIIIFIILYLILILNYSLIDSLIYSVIVTLIHISIDWIKYKYFKSPKPILDLTYFLIDQILHLLTIIILSLFLPLSDNIYTHNFLYYTIYELDLPNKINFKRICIVLIVYIIFCKVSTIIINKFLDYAVPRITSNILKPIKKTGMYIGIFERAVIITLIFNHEFSTIGLVLAAKSVARYKELENQFSAEYYLLGTLISVFFGILGGIFLLYLYY